MAALTYADYSFYTEEYCGNKIEESDFDRLAVKAAAVINSYTGQILENDEITDEVKCAACEICDILYAEESHEGMKYERNDGYWVSYEERDVYTEKIEKCVKTWLMSGGLLYRGRNF